MTGGGLLALVAYGSQNVILSGNPQMTYFYKAFKRYSHFAMESITVPLEGPNELSFDQPVQLRAKIPRYGDLMSDLIFSFRVPDIYSKYMTPVPQRTSQWEFQWVRYLGAALIQNAAFFVGGQKIQEFDGSYLVSRALLDLDQDEFYKWKALVGDVPELNEPSVSAYAGGTTHTGYPSVIPNPTVSTAQQLNRPSIMGRDIHVPLSFWFTESPSLALPLIGLQYHECEVQLTLNPTSQLYTVLDASGYRVNSEWGMRASTNSIDQNNPAYVSVSDISGQIRNFFKDFGPPPADLNGWNVYPRLQGTFIYLPTDEQKIFAGRPLSYLVNQVTAYPFPGQYTRQILDLQTHNPITRLIFIQRRSDALARNDFANFTNWFTYPFAPFMPTPNVLSSLQKGYSSGLLIPNAQQDIIRALRVLCNGNEIQEEKNVDYFTRISPYRYTKGIGQDGLPIYSFQLGQSATQPSGSINASRIRNFQVEVDVWPLPVGTNYTYDITIYAENMNWFEVVSGMGGLKYAL
jgi:Major capsid protein N-terminus/Large eukaryotic DNA virus major capsid protein